MFKIMIDAGHYGKYNQSPANLAYYESDMTWKLHNYLVAELNNYDVQVDTTRAVKEKDLPVYERGRKARGYDLFLSLHSNAVGASANDNVDFPSIYYLHTDTAGEAFATDLVDQIATLMSTKQSGRVNTKVQTNGLEYYGVLRGAAAVNCPHAFIVEHSFHTAAKPAAWLMNDTNLRKMAKMEAQTIASFYHLELKAEPMTPQEKQEFDNLKKRVYNIEKNEKIYSNVNDLPSWAKKQIQEAIDNHWISGTGNGKLDLTEDLMRMLLIYRNIKS